jgi:hypothetical protein
MDSQLSVGPEAALSLLVGQLITDAMEADPHHLPKHPEQVALAISGITAMQVSTGDIVFGLLLRIDPTKI